MRPYKLRLNISLNLVVIFPLKMHCDSRLWSFLIRMNKRHIPSPQDNVGNFLIKPKNFSEGMMFLCSPSFLLFCCHCLFVVIV
jgi:hypothetical protein